jgi:hypothetical protein
MTKYVRMFANCVDCLLFQRNVSASLSHAAARLTRGTSEAYLSVRYVLIDGSARWQCRQRWSSGWSGTAQMRRYAVRRVAVSYRDRFPHGRQLNGPDIIGNPNKYKLIEDAE